MSAIAERIPVFCPTCGYHAADEADMVEHWARSGAYEWQDGNAVVSPWIGHSEPNGATTATQTAWETEAEPEDCLDEGADMAPVFRLPLMYRVAYIVALVLGVLMIGLVVSVAAFFFTPYVLDPLVNVGPLKPYAALVRFLWEYGLVLLPLLGLGVAIWLVPSLRERAREIVMKGIVWIGLGLWGVVLAAIIFWTVLRMIEGVGG